MRGAVLKGEKNKNKKVTQRLKEERKRATKLAPGDPRFGLAFHSYIQHSFTVRRAVLKALDLETYLPGIWTVSLNGRVTDPEGDPVDIIRGSIGEFVLDYTDETGTTFVARRWVHKENRYVFFEGMIVGPELEGFFVFVPDPDVNPCPVGKIPDTKGTFAGTTTFRTTTMEISGSTPFFTLPPGCDVVFMGDLKADADWRLLFEI